MSKSIQIQTVEVEAQSLEEAQKQLKQKIPEGWYVLSEEVISEPRIRTVLVRAYDEDSAREKAKRELNIAASVESIQLKEKGKKGLLGIGRRPHSYEVQITPTTERAKTRVILREGLEPEFITIPEGLTEAELNDWFQRHNIPHQIEDMEIFKCSSKPEFFIKGERGSFGALLTGDDEGLFYKDEDGIEWVIKKALVQRIKLSFGVGHAAEVSFPGFGVHYADPHTPNFAYGCEKFSKLILDIDKIVYYPDLPCVIVCPRTQENVHWEIYFLCFKDGPRSCLVREMSFRWTAEETARRQEAAELAKQEKEDQQLAKGPVSLFRDQKSSQSVRERAFEMILSEKENRTAWLVELLEESDSLTKWPFVSLLIRERNRSVAAIEHAIKNSEASPCLSQIKSVLEFADKCEIEEPTLMEYQKNIIEGTAGLQGYALCYKQEDDSKTAFKVLASLCFAAKNIERESHRYVVVLAKSRVAVYPYIVVVLTNAPEIDGYYSSVVCGRNLVPISDYLKNTEFEHMSFLKAQAFLKEEVDYTLGYVTF